MDLWGAVTGVMTSDPAQKLLSAGADAAVANFIDSNNEEEKKSSATSASMTTPPADAAKTGLPSWAIPAAVGGGVVLLLVVGGLAIRGGGE